jgi:hypothetical protein
MTRLIILCAAIVALPAAVAMRLAWRGPVFLEVGQ